MNSINEKEQFKKDLFNKSITKWYNILLKIFKIRFISWKVLKKNVYLLLCSIRLISII